MTNLILLLALAAPQDGSPDLTVTGKGVQIYACQNNAWVFQSPEAALFDSQGKQIGTHGAGPSWKFNDGRSVKGAVVTKTDAPSKDDIPYLLLKGEGSFAFIRRTETHGGTAPSGKCEDGKTLRVPYSATYLFYSGHL